MNQFSMLAELIEKLVRYEERVVFPFLENNLTKAQLNFVGQKLEGSFIEKDDDGYQDQFWTEINTGKYALK